MRIKKFSFIFGLVILSMATMIWGVTFFHTLREYEKYCELVRDQELGLPIPYHAWDGGKYINIALIVSFFLWIPFLDYSLRKKTFPFLRKKLTYRRSKIFWRSVARSLYEHLYGLVLGYFTRVNRRVRAKIAFWFMKVETLEHVHLLTKVFKWVVLPSSILYVCAMFYFFGKNALDSMFIGVLLFFYSNFLPDLPSIYRRRNENGESKDVVWYKKYSLLLFAPLLIWAFYSGIRLRWRTTDTFHNFKSLTVFGGFLLLLSFFAFGDLPLSVGDLLEIAFVPLYGLIGYLTHLKVDKIW